MDTEKMTAFPSEIYLFRNDGTVDNEQVVRAIYSLREQDPEGVHKSNMGGGWHSNEYLFQDPRFEKLMMFISTCFKMVLEDNNYKKEVVGDIDASWAIVNKHASFNVAHVHANTDWSCCFYPRMPAGDPGRIVFKDPRSAKSMVDHSKYLDNYDSLAQHSVLALTPYEEELVIFPAWLEHEVHPNNTNEDRIALACNIQLKLEGKDEKGGY